MHEHVWADRELLSGAGGQAKRCNIGIALLSDPRLIFLDEPTSGLDSYTSHEVCLLSLPPCCAHLCQVLVTLAAVLSTAFLARPVESLSRCQGCRYYPCPECWSFSLSCIGVIRATIPSMSRGGS